MIPRDQTKSAAPDVAGPDGLASTRNTLPIALLRAREALMERLRPVLHVHDITEQQWRVVRILREERALDASTLAEHACILAPSLTRILKTLEARGIVAMEKDDSDGRRRVVSLTEAGHRLIAEVSPQVRRINSGIEEALGRELMDDLLGKLDRLLDRLDEDRA
ncbi:homoprotocatechuate degradation operon regulator HpaR [Pseudogemmobacter sonorensis]|uniref:homoprotocatechuate degradation operon regulator HpaR n=1 Tax=Pseudogemmobacter sonorensis TaxID=2989681 RepID=UPI0036C9CEC2